jgi:serine protease AprX
MSTPGQPELPDRVYAEAVVRSPTGSALLDTDAPITSATVDRFIASQADVDVAAKRLQAAGFDVVDRGPFSVTVAAPPAVYEQAFRTCLEAIERPVIKEQGRITTASFINAADSAPFGRIDVSDTRFDVLLNGVAINEPVYYYKASPPAPTPPSTETEYLSVPDGLAEGLNATAAHRQGITGKGVKVVMVDTGWYPHPYFAKHNYTVNVQLAPGSTDACSDPIGHGTGVAANLLAIAPEADLTVLKADVAIAGTLKSVNSVSALRAAIRLKPDIISCSWASDQRSPQLSPSNRVLAATVAYAVRQGITVVFSAGNGHLGFPSQHPDVLAVGGVYRHLQGSLKGTLEASNYASGFVSPVYPGRRVPDVCGLVGQLPYGCYIMLPVPPSSVIDQDLGSPIRDGTPSKDGTQGSDGWAAFSGTSAAAPQVAGVCALIKQVKSNLSPAEIKQLLQQTTIDVSHGFSNPSSGGSAARDGPDFATGYGLVDSYKPVVLSCHERIKPHKTLISLRQLNLNPIQSIPETSFGTITMQYYHPRLQKNLDQVIWELEKTLHKIITDLNLEDVQLDFRSIQFADRTPISRVAYSLRLILEEDLQFSLNPASGSFDIDNSSEIKEKHVSAAQGLIKIGRYQEVSVVVLTQALLYGSESVKTLAADVLSGCGDSIKLLQDNTSVEAPDFVANEFVGPDRHGKCYIVDKNNPSVRVECPCPK